MEKKSVAQEWADLCYAGAKVGCDNCFATEICPAALGTGDEFLCQLTAEEIGKYI